MVLDTIGPLPKTYNMYILVAIDHYFNWCKTKAMVDHDTNIATRFLEDEIICKFVVPKYILSRLVQEMGSSAKGFENLTT